jgi:hypothetical protein
LALSAGQSGLSLSFALPARQVDWEPQAYSMQEPRKSAFALSNHIPFKRISFFLMPSSSHRDSLWKFFVRNVPNALKNGERKGRSFNAPA